MKELKDYVPALPVYYADVIAWHGYVRFLGLSTFQENPDLSLGDLYVPHYVSEQLISPDSDPSSWITQDPIEFISKNRKIVVLGDPGSGKSTLLNWLSWYMASGFERRMPAPLDTLLPIPIVLRDLPKGPLGSVERLLELFLEMPVAESLVQYRAELFSLLHEGRLMLLIDGLDEVPPEVGAAVHRAVAEDPWSNFSVITSRIIGYSEYQKFQLSRTDSNSQISDASGRRGSLTLSVCYVAPFNDEQISGFARNWYREQDVRRSGVDRASDEFVAAIKSDPASLRLARTPNLLTIMALIYRKLVKLPNGRALLYDEISRAYLESIDTARKLKDEFPWNVKRRWLSRIGFEMQLARVVAGESSHEGGRELVADRADVLSWLDDAISKSDIDQSPGYAARYLDWITRRSGLLLPRGEGKYAFLHLSFQEYFAARYLKGQVEHPSWPRGDGLDSRLTRGKLKNWFNTNSWSQVFVFLFELFSGKPGWTERLLSLCPMQPLKESSEPFGKPTSSPSVTLMAELIGNPHAGFNSKMRQKWFEKMLPFVEQELDLVGRKISIDSIGKVEFRTVLDRLLASTATGSIALNWLRSTSENRSEIMVSGLPKGVFNEISEIVRSMNGLKIFAAHNCDVVSADFLKGLTYLEIVSFVGCSIEDVSCLSGASSMRKLCLSDTRVTDIGVASRFEGLRSIDLEYSPVKDVSPISKCLDLTYLDVASTKVVDLSHISELRYIQTLSIQHTKVSDISFICPDNLEFVNAAWSGIGDVEMLRFARNLFMLFITNTKIEDLSPLSECIALEFLAAGFTPVRDISPISRLSKLRWLVVDRTLISDLSPLSALSNLFALDIDHCPVNDLGPLVNLKRLSSLSIIGCPVSEVPEFQGRVTVKR